jgi:hypothetical protein
LGRNPANIGLMARRREVFTAYQFLIDGAQYSHTALAFSPHLEAIDGLGLALTHMAIGGIPGADANAHFTGNSFSAADTAITVGASSLVLSNLRLGLDVKGVQSKIGSYSSQWTLAADFGLSLSVAGSDERPIVVAMSADNVGQPIRFLSQSDPLPMAFKLGIAAPFARRPTLFAQVKNQVYDQVTTAAAGMEYAFGFAYFRAGYSYVLGTPANLAQERQSTIRKIFGGFSAGVGIQWRACKLDYAFSTQAVDYGATQRLSVTLAWGGRSDLRSGVMENKPDRYSWLTDSSSLYE